MDTDNTKHTQQLWGAPLQLQSTVSRLQQSMPQHFVLGRHADACWELGQLECSDEGVSRLVVKFKDVASNTGGRVQGGAIASIFDVAGLVAVIEQTQVIGPTAFLNVTYKSAGELNTVYVVTARVRCDGRKCFVDMDMRKGPEDNAVARAEALFVLARSRL